MCSVEKFDRKIDYGGKSYVDKKMGLLGLGFIFIKKKLIYFFI